MLKILSCVEFKFRLVIIFIVLFGLENVYSQNRYISFINEYYDLSDGIHSFIIYEDSTLDSSQILIMDTSIITGVKFYLEPSTFAKVFELAGVLITPSNCMASGSDSLIVEFNKKDINYLRIGYVCDVNSIEYFDKLAVLTKSIHGITYLTDFLKSCSLSMKDSLDLKEINRRK